MQCLILPPQTHHMTLHSHFNSLICCRLLRIACACRPVAVRLALLQKLLLSWKPDQQHLQAFLDVIVPLLAADRQKLLTTAEAAVLHNVTGECVVQGMVGGTPTLHRL
jgi:hypothetical protein